MVIATAAPGAWVAAPALGLTLLALVVADALAAGSLGALRLEAPAEVEVGAEGRVRLSASLSGGRATAVEAALAADPRLFPQGRAATPLRFNGAEWEATLAFTPERRGSGAIERVWLRWAGPLGLGARQRSVSETALIRVRPNLAEVRSPTLQTFLRDLQFGLVARRLRGEGSEFEALAEYRPGVDRRRIDWKSSARHARLFAKEFETERNSQIVFAVDCGRAMCEPVGGMPRIDRAISAALATAYVALKGGDRVALFGFAARPELMTPFFAGARDFHRIRSAAATLDYRAQEPNFTLALATLAGRLKRRSLVIVFSEFGDPTGIELMIESVGRLLARHRVLFVTLADEELEEIAVGEPGEVQTLAMAVTADALLRQRALALGRLRQLGVDVLEAPHARIGTRLIDAYLAIKRAGTIG